MVNFVVVSHSYKLAESVINLAKEMQNSNFLILNGSGLSETDTSTFGSNPQMILKAIKNAYTNNGVLIFVDIGSSVINSQIAIDWFLENNSNANIKIADSPIVEGLIAATAANFENATLTSILNELELLKTFSKI